MPRQRGWRTNGLPGHRARAGDWVSLGGAVLVLVGLAARGPASTSTAAAG
ncbi:hypothetical protein [Actinokineospora diospyrosa]|uniref:Uncharacterized protein n=1 Tax=Actinokineospora diospyrosa TaxID=103728 RepID=A0ABT1IEU9_9PSEU|nr:hypothetical protein [Actinokineospora diospyrosa]MCP2271084.1 hypothetical protein [Actinokineospora diospyrosa]